MSEQGSRPDRQPDAADLGRRDYRTTEEELSRAFAKIRLLDDASHPASLNQFVERARQVKESYEEWLKNGSAIRGIVVRPSNGERADLARLRGGQCSIRCTADLSASTCLDIFKEADAKFGEVLLLRLPLPKEGITVERSYPNGQTLSLRVEQGPNAVLSIAVEIAEPVSDRSMEAAVDMDESPYRISMGRLQQLLNGPWRLAYAACALVLVMSGLWLPLQHDSVGYKSVGPTGYEEVAVVPVKESSRDDSTAVSLRELDAPRGVSEDHSPPASSAHESTPWKRGTTLRARIGHSVPREAFAPATVAMSLDAYEMVRGEEQRAKRVLRVSESTKLVRLVLHLPYDVNLGRHDITLLRSYEIFFTVRQNSVTDRVITLSVPSSVLYEGDYTLLVTCDDGPPVRYEFSVVGREMPRLRKGDETQPADEPQSPKPMVEPSEV